MDDTQTRVEFPIGDSGKTVIVTAPTQSQILVLALARAPKDGDNAGALKMAKRMFRLLESLTGDQYGDVIEEGLMVGEFSVLQVTELIADIARFDWASAAQPVPDGEPDPVSTPAAPKPGPRIVKSA